MYKELKILTNKTAKFILKITVCSLISYSSNNEDWTYAFPWTDLVSSTVTLSPSAVAQTVATFKKIW